MELTLNRRTRTNKSTIGDFKVNGTQICFALEDKDRGLTSSMTLSEIKKKKIFGKTAISTGRYEVILSYSERFKKFLPLLLSVPGFDGIRMHSGNKEEDSLGCLLLGETESVDWVGSSKDAMTEFMNIFEPASKKEKIFITIT